MLLYITIVGKLPGLSHSAKGGNPVHYFGTLRPKAECPSMAGWQVPPEHEGQQR